MVAPQKKYKDSLGRVLRSVDYVPGEPVDWGPPEPSALHDKILQFIYSSGGYSTTELIHRFTRATGLTTQKASTYISQQLYLMRRKFRLITCPCEQFDRRRADRFQLYFGLTRMGKERVERNPDVPSQRGHYKHQMLATIHYATEWLETLEAGFKVTPQHELPIRNKDFMVDRKYFRPDSFLIAHLDRPILLFNESDRSTEFATSKKAHTTWDKRINTYHRFLSQKIYRKFINVPDNHIAFMCVLTTTQRMQDFILRRIEKQFPKGHARFLIRATSAFGTDPKRINPAKNLKLMSEYWMRSNYPSWKFI